MIEVIFLSVLSIISDQDKANALRIGEEQTIQSTAERCVGRNAVRFAQYTNENAKDVAQYAALTCTKEITAMSKTASAFNLNFDGLVRQFELKVIEWRADAAEKGTDAYKQAAIPYGPVIQPSAESSQ
jgi:nucleoid-associated protein YejK